MVRNLLGQLKQSIDDNALEQRPVLFAPFLLAIGILTGLDYFLGSELKYIVLIGIIFGLISAGLATFRFEKQNRFYDLALNLSNIALILVFGVFLIVFKSQKVQAPIIPDKAIYKNISGEIINISRSNSYKWRVLLRTSEIAGVKHSNLPKFIRLNVENIDPLTIGKRLKCDGFLAPPSGPVLPDKYDFALKAWFQQIGAVGACNGDFALSDGETPLMFERIANTLTNWRNYSAQNITNGEIGGGRGLLSALMTGNRSYVSESENEALRISGLGHIVSVSGLHVGLLAAIVFFPLRKLLICIPNFALFFDVRKIAAIFTLGILSLYTFLTGAEAPALRALIMAFVAFVGLIFDRRAISMRGLAISALILLCIFPEQAIDPGFQMSFLATMALIALWEWYEKHQDSRPKTLLEKIAFWPTAAGLTSLCAGLATIPISLFNFSAINTYGLFANLIAAPISDFIIGPFAAIGALFSAIGLGEAFLNIAAWGCEIILKIGAFFASLPQYVPLFGEFGPISLASMTLGIVWFCVFHGLVRKLAIIPFFLGFCFWVLLPKPALFIGANGEAFLRPPSKGKEARLCFIRGAGFEANLLLNSISLPIQEKLRLEAIAHKHANQCAVNDGDFEAHFISAKTAKDQAKTNGLLSLTINGKTHWLGNNTPIGAKVYRINATPSLMIGKQRAAPWNRLYSKTINSDDKAIQERLEP